MTTTSVTTAAKTIGVMIVDDSALMRKLLTELLSRSAEIEIVDTAMDGQFALEHLKRVRPDVILMDVEMPRLDGLTALDHIVADYGLPVVMCSAHTTAGTKSTIEALARGAVDFIEKPSIAALTSGEAAAEIISRVRGAAGARVVPRRRQVQSSGAAVMPAASTGARSVLEQVKLFTNRVMPEIVAIGTSTGGPPALEQVLTPLPVNFPVGIVIVQHMPAGFTSLLAEHLNRVVKIEVREATDGEAIVPGVAFIAPGGAHLRVVRSRGQYVTSVDTQGPLVGGHRPSVDVLFDSLVQTSRGRAAAVLMTGMGSDGAEGLGRLADAGAVTIAQSPDSCVCFGMPKSAIDRGYARAVIPLEELGSALMACGSREKPQ